MSLRVGIDLVKAATVREAIAEHGDHYLARVYTEGERAECGDDPLRLASRFAAKEAAVKILRPGPDDAVPWQAIEVLRGDGVAPELTLHGTAAELARAAGITAFAVSITHEDEYAAAVVVGT